MQQQRYLEMQHAIRHNGGKVIEVDQERNFSAGQFRHPSNVTSATDPGQNGSQQKSSIMKAGRSIMQN